MPNYVGEAGEYGSMSALRDENSEPISKVQQVRQAASVMGISERTVYRRLRSGRLDQLPTETPVADSVMTVVNDATIAELISAQIEPHLHKMVCQNDMTNDKLSALSQELVNRDVQIRTLLENQKELTLTIQKLQAQIYELARLALTQAPKSDDQTPGAPSLSSPPSSGKPKNGNPLLRFLRRWSKDRQLSD
jgi:hypothetical protein